MAWKSEKNDGSKSEREKAYRMYSSYIMVVKKAVSETEVRVKEACGEEMMVTNA